jgi:dTDP-4-amino-4,6-dideoxygalactose transaminase
MTTVPFYKPSIGQAEIDEVIDTLRSGWLTTGPKTKRFEVEFAAYIGQQHAVAVNSCTAALHLALDAIGLKPGQTVVVPTMTFAATAEVVRYFNAKPLLVDCRESDFNLDVADAEQRIGEARAKGEEVVAIIPVHYGGQIGNVEGVSCLAGKYNLTVIEDAAHCCPAFYRSEVRGQRSEVRGQRSEVRGQKSEVRGQRSEVRDQKSEVRARTSDLPIPDWKPVGAEAAITCFSFYANKTITTGEGGMACTNNAAYAERMRIMSLHGISKDAWKRFTAEGSWYYEIVAPGFKYNLTDIAAALGLHQLRRADELHRRRTHWARWFNEQLAHIDEIILPWENPDRVHSWHLYPIRLRLDRLRINRAEFIDELKRNGVGSSVHWLPLHMHPYYRDTYGYQPGDISTAARLYPELITLPLYADLEESDAAHVCEVTRRIVEAQRK